MVSTVLITGGAGFIGSHLTDRLLAQGHRVRILDTLVPQVHGSSARRPSYLSREAEFMQGDIRDPNAVQRAVKDVSGVVHLAATVGVGQSMYQIHRYSDVNAVGDSGAPGSFGPPSRRATCRRLQYERLRRGIV